jgi:formylglycine-generating enzyme required for sulfatase activity
VQGLSFVAILEYSYWLSERTPRWKFSMATDLQWEKAARGADWRRYVWGEHLIWSLCWSKPGVNICVRDFPTCRGAYPFDESVYGVRDMGGSVTEFAIGKPLARKIFRSVRGGGWGKFNEYRFRTDSRFGVPPLSTNTSSGIRLVATPDP